MELCGEVLKIREEKVTINILKWLKVNNWTIVCYDFPQSGTGILLQSIEEKSKNKKGIIPDIISVRDNVALFFENKDRYFAPDFEKLRDIKKSGNYDHSINTLLSAFNVTTIYYGIGIPDIQKHTQAAMKDLDEIDFLISTSESGEINILFEKNSIFS